MIHERWRGNSPACWEKVCSVLFMLQSRADPAQLATFHALCGILDSDSQIDEMGWLASFDLVSGDPNNMVDAQWRHLFYLSQHKLAIHKKALSQLLFAGFSLFCALQPSISLLSNGDPSISIDTISEIHNTTRILTLLNPHHYTAWNTRKQLILHFPTFNTPITANAPDKGTPRSTLITESCQSELLHIELALSKQPKSVEAWAHRKWVLHTLSLNQTPSSYQFEASREVRLCNTAASTHKRNYYSWTHRLYIVRHWHQLAPSHGDIQEQNVQYSSFLRSELQETWHWLQKHYSDASATHHLYIVLKRLKIVDICELLGMGEAKSPEEAIKMLLDESTKYLTLYRAGESWWYVRRWVLSLYICQSIERDTLAKCLEEVQKVLKIEIQQVETGLRDLDEQRLFSYRHLVWIIRFLQKQFVVADQELDEELKVALEISEKELLVMDWKAGFSETHA